MVSCHYLGLDMMGRTAIWERIWELCQRAICIFCYFDSFDISHWKGTSLESKIAKSEGSLPHSEQTWGCVGFYGCAASRSDAETAFGLGNGAESRNYLIDSDMRSDTIDSIVSKKEDTLIELLARSAKNDDHQYSESRNVNAGFCLHELSLTGLMILYLIGQALVQTCSR